MTQLEVWGDPIAHSRSPLLHLAAYAALDLQWSYDRRQVSEAQFGSVLRGLDDSYRGLSVTYPLKGEAFRAAASLDRRAELSGVVNTLLLTDAAGPRGFNTDIGGLAADIREHGVNRVDHARIVGAGATAASALIALAELGAQEIDVVARRPEAIRSLASLGHVVGVKVRGAEPDAQSLADVALTVSALPGNAVFAPELADALADVGGILYDVVYDPWPTVLAEAWERRGHRTVNGAGMLLQQAVLQVRIFVNGDPELPLTNEDEVVAAMRGAIMGE